MSASTFDESALERRVSAFLRDALARRYSLDNIRNYAGFSGMTDAQVSALRDFGLRHIYPDWDGRCFQRRAFDKIMALLDTPLRLRPLTAVALKSLWRFGRHLPRAIEAGKQVIRAFEATRNLEEEALSFIHEKGTTTSVLGGEDAPIIAAISAAPSEEFALFVSNLVALMELIAQRSLLDTGVSVLRDIHEAMEKNKDAYDADERNGVRYAVDIMTEGIALFDTLDEDAVRCAIAEIPRVEGDWFSEIQSSASLGV